MRKEVAPTGKELGTKIDICDEQAQVIRRIFTMYLEGNSFATIARTLNTEGVQPPRVHAANRRKGWKDSTIRAMLHNESYIGRWRYRASQWRKVPGTNRRVPVRRDDTKAIVRERPNLRIIEDALWHEVQDRLERVRLFYTRTKDGS